MNSHQEKYTELFVNGPISPSTIAEHIQQHSIDKRIGACQFFLGQVRDDKVDGEPVQAIEYTAYKSMAGKTYGEIRQQIFDAYPIRGLHVLHSIGTVKAGQTSLFVLVTAEHRKEAINACRDTIQLIKEKLPVWGKELFNDGDYIWKENEEVQ